MKTGIFMADGVTQVILTPENATDEAVIKHIESSEKEVYRGQFYECRDGWVRQGPGESSLILVLRAKAVNPQAPLKWE